MALELVDPQVMQPYLDGGLVTARPHSVAPLTIYNYTPACQYGRQWDESFGGLDLAAARSIQDPTREGFVIRFASGMRVKIKFEEYVRLHKILTHITARNLYEYLAIAAMRDHFNAGIMGRALFMDPAEVALIAAAPDPFAEILERVPDEFRQWVAEQREALTGAYNMIEANARREFRSSGDRKQDAAYFAECETNKSILFKMLDGRPYDDAIWRLIRPDHVKPFRRDIDA